MQSNYALCRYSFRHLRSISIFLFTVIIIGTVESSIDTSFHHFYTNGTSIEMRNDYRNESLTSYGVMSKTNSDRFEGMEKSNIKSRGKRSIIQLASMIRCVSGCDPFLYKSYGCYCGYLGAGKPVDAIDRCCLLHDWCYTHAACPQILVYFLPYQWSCITPGYAKCGIVPFGGIKQKCSYQLCECDREFVKCLSQYHCPSEKPICQSSPFIALQNIIVGR